MNPNSTESTDSKATAPSPGWEEVFALGRQIVDQLDDRRQHDLLSCWMAHYLAELMLRAREAPDEKKEELQRECSEIVLRVWEKRSYWPRGAPIELSYRLLSLIDPDPHSKTTDPGSLAQHLDVSPCIFSE